MAAFRNLFFVALLVLLAQEHYSSCAALPARSALIGRTVGGVDAHRTASCEPGDWFVSDERPMQRSAGWTNDPQPPRTDPIVRYQVASSGAEVTR